LKIAGQLDYMLMDIKSMDDQVHKEWTGVSNRLILENFRAVRESFPNLTIHVRTPVIPGVNDSEEAIKEIHDFLMNFDNVRYELLKYHRLGESKYESLHRAYPMGDRKLDDEGRSFKLHFRRIKNGRKGQEFSTWIINCSTMGFDFFLYCCLLKDYCDDPQTS
jgi:pyruvate-formate lyase-activating enzyme